MVKMKIVSSLEKVTSVKEKLCEIRNYTMFQNEKFSLQMVIESDLALRNLKIKVKGFDKKYICFYKVIDVPTRFVEDPLNKHDDFFLSFESKSIPDVLVDINQSGIITYKNSFSTLFISISGEINPDNYNIEFSLVDENNKELAKNCILLKVLNKKLQSNKLLLTNWFHYDVLATIYDVKLFSKKYYKILKNYIDNYVNHGNNMILTPIFTPCLDTKYGKERKNVQLVDVYYEQDKYRFDFKKLKEFILFMKERGIMYFEMSHLFTQWGAHYCPSILVHKNNKIIKLFGWKIESDSKEYRMFLKQFLPQLDIFLGSMNISENVFFHISDEPSIKDSKLYHSHRLFMKEYLPNHKFMDALSEYELKDEVDMPVVAVDANTFLSSYKKEHMVYYCCSQLVNYAPNRFINMPSIRNRILGYLMYLEGAIGFLQYGHNYYFNFLSLDLINPYIMNDADGRFNPGDGFVVYPRLNGKLYNSIRHEVFYDAIQDYNLCLTIANVVGQEKVKEVLKKHGLIAYSSYPHDIDSFNKIREELLILLNI